MTLLDQLGDVTPDTRAKTAEVLNALEWQADLAVSALHGKAVGIEHGTGLAVDFMVYSGPGGAISATSGDFIANYILEHRARLGLNWVIWRQRINSGDGWRAMEDRRNPDDPSGQTVNHMDHVHAYFTNTPYQPGEDPMPTLDEIATAVWSATIAANGSSASDVLNAASDVERFWDRKVTGRPGGPVRAIQELADTKTGILALQGTVAGLSEAVKQIASSQGLDPARIEAAVEDAVRRAIASSIKVEGTVEVVTK